MIECDISFACVYTYIFISTYNDNVTIQTPKNCGFVRTCGAAAFPDEKVIIWNQILRSQTPNEQRNTTWEGFRLWIMIPTPIINQQGFWTMLKWSAKVWCDETWTTHQPICVCWASLLHAMATPTPEASKQHLALAIASGPLEDPRSWKRLSHPEKHPRKFGCNHRTVKDGFTCHQRSRNHQNPFLRNVKPQNAINGTNSQKYDHVFLSARTTGHFASAVYFETPVS